MTIIEIPEGETREIISPNIIEFWRNGEVHGEAHKGIAEAIMLTGVKGLTIVLTDRLPNKHEE